MKTTNHILIQHVLRMSLTVSAIALCGPMSELAGQVLKNNGTVRNTGTATYNSVENYKTNVGGTIVNSGTFNVNNSFDNDDGGTGIGTVRNYIGGTGAGTIRVTTSLTNERGTWDNDSLNGYVGRTRVAGTFTNTTGTIDTDSGAVDYFGAGAQAILATSYGALITAVGGTKTITGTVTVQDTLRIMSGSTLALGATTDSLAIRATNQTVGGTFTKNLGAVNYYADANQAVQGGQYQRLYVSGSTAARTKTSTSGLSFAASGALSIGSNDTLVVSGGSLDLNTSTPSFTNGSVVKPLADATFHGGITNAGSFYYAGTSTQTIGAVTYADLRLGASGGKTMPTGTVAVTGSYSIDPGTGARDYTTNSNIFQFAGTSGTQAISGLSETFYQLQFTGAADKTLSGTTLGAARMDILATSGIVTNNVTTLTLTNLSTISMTIASGTTFIQGTGTLTSTGGDIENDGTFENNGTITVN